MVRGERRAAAIRHARETGQEPPKRRYHARTPQWRAAEELRLARQAAEHEATAAQLDQRSNALVAREAEAETILAGADGIADGSLTIDTQGDTPRLAAGQGASTAPTPSPDPDALHKRSPRGVARAVAAFGSAWTRLTARADAEAKAGVAEAVAQIAAADDRIVEIATRMREPERMEIAKMRQALTARLTALGRWLRGDAKADGHRKPGPHEGGEKKPFFHNALRILA